jgi:P-type conjugative transfer protein TrbJ
MNGPSKVPLTQLILPLLLSLLFLVLVWVTAAHAQIFGTGVLPVTEVGASLYQQGLQSIRALASNVNEVQQLNQQVQQLANDARNLAQLPLSVVAEIQQTMSSYQGLLNQGRLRIRPNPRWPPSTNSLPAETCPSRNGPRRS